MIITDKGGATLHVAESDGHLLMPIPGIVDRLKHLENIQVKQDDILLAGFPKSGNHWVWELCSRILHNNIGPFKEYMGLSSLDANDCEGLSKIDEQRVLHSHLPLRILTRAKELFNGKHRIVYVYRNPKDVAVSYYTQVLSFENWYKYQGEWKDYLDLFLEGRVDSGSWFDHVLSWKAYSEEHPEIPILFLSYEDLSRNLITELRKLILFLGVNRDEKFLEKLFQKSQFQVMKENHDKYAPDEMRELYRDGEMTMFRKASMIVCDKGGATLNVAEVEGHLLMPLPGIAERLQNLENFRVKGDDVLVAGFPKSGNHWIWEICFRILYKNLGPFKDYMGNSSIENRESQELAKNSDPRVLHSHLPLQIITKAKDLFNGKHKIIYIYRNPKDVAVSYYTQVFNFKDLYGYNGEWKDYLDLFLDGRVDSGSWFDHVLSWKAYSEEHPEIPILFLSYEDLSRNLKTELQKLISFLGVERGEEFIEKLIELSQFRVMKENHDQYAPVELKELYLDGNITMFRKGVIGDWRETFTVAQSENFDKVFAQKIRHSNIDIYFGDKNNSW